MAKINIDKMIALNAKGKTLKEIAEIIGTSWQYVWKLIHKDKRYIPGKKGFARLSKERMRAISSKGAMKANEMGLSHKWNSKEAKVASKKGKESRKRNLHKVR